MNTEKLINSLRDSPYNLDKAAASVLEATLSDIRERIGTLRQLKRLTQETLERYYGRTRFQQVAESNAIEGSPLTVGETELAVLKGTTLTGLDPGYVKDAITLNKALVRLVEMARNQAPLDIPQLKELHEIILEGRPGAGSFRSQPVRISGSQHKPPSTWKEVMDQMEQWERWSIENQHLDPILRGVVLHAWFVHIHPFVDGNGRTARALTNLELIRQGYPSIIIRKNQDRDRYIYSLQESDQGGDISHLADLVVERFNGSLIGLEQAAREMEGYDPLVIKLREAQQRKLDVWNRSVELLFQIVLDRLTPYIENVGGKIDARVYRDSLALDEYISLCNYETVPHSWVFKLKASVPGLESVERLAWIGFRGSEFQSRLNDQPVSPAVYWSKPNPFKFPPWVLASQDAPAIKMMTITPGFGDEWHIIDVANNFKRMSTTELGQAISDGFINILSQ